MLAWLRQAPRSARVLSIVATLVLLGAAIKREPCTRPLLTAQLSISGRAVPKGEAVKAEAQWAPLEDVDVVGWALYVKTLGATATLLTSDRRILARTAGGSDEIKPQFVAAGTAHRLRVGDQLTLRLDIPARLGEQETSITLAHVHYLPAGR